MSNIRFDLSTQPDALSTSRLLYVTASRFDTDWSSIMHTHPCTELFYCVRGIGEFVLAGKSQPVGGDDMVIVNANVEHTESSLPSNPLEYIVLGVDGLDFSFEDSGLPYGILNCREIRDSVGFYLRQLLCEAEAKEERYETMCQHLLQVLFMKLLRNQRMSLHANPVRRGNKECATARRYIDEHYFEAISLDRLAELTHVNKYHLVHTFHKEYGITPIYYLMDRRIRESKYLLRNTDHSLTHISQVLGFSSPSYFSQSFRRLAGQSPMAYRKAARDSLAQENAKQ